LIRYCVKNKLSIDWMFGVDKRGKQASAGLSLKLDSSVNALKKAVLSKGGKKLTEEKLALIMKFMKNSPEYKDAYKVVSQLLCFLEFMAV